MKLILNMVASSFTFESKIHAENEVGTTDRESRRKTWVTAAAISSRAIP